MYTGDSIPIPCEVTGLPAPSISYRVNTATLSVTDGMLTDVSAADSGAYQCFVENTHGVVTASWTITVRDPGECVSVMDHMIPCMKKLSTYVQNISYPNSCTSGSEHV